MPSSGTKSSVQRLCTDAAHTDGVKTDRVQITSFQRPYTVFGRPCTSTHPSCFLSLRSAAHARAQEQHLRTPSFNRFSFVPFRLNEPINTRLKPLPSVFITRAERSSRNLRHDLHFREEKLEKRKKTDALLSTNK